MTQHVRGGLGGGLCPADYEVWPVPFVPQGQDWGSEGTLPVGQAQCHGGGSPQGQRDPAPQIWM